MGELLLGVKPKEVQRTWLEAYSKLIGERGV